ncbi:MAG: histidine phosphatase family protein [Gammaproteobacteria bacterium]|jgi:phosphohistidine phosphatase|nr:histidine phosphatase family protein [Gammaproteobacteria bacterium]MDH3749725.1 histidine phosphatase family protein [Gammaproteobacteria bacterium]
MKTLTLVRHAKSSWKDSGLSDRERPLNKRGERDAPVMGKRAAAAGLRPSQIISSPAVRAWTTAKIFAKALNYPIEFLQREDGLYLASLDNFLDVVATQDAGFNNLMLFAHNPGLTDFANYLVPGITNNLPTAGLVSVNLDCNDWMLYDRPQAELVIYDYPKKQQ